METGASGTSVTRYGLGARGVDLIERTSGSNVVTAFPIYDAHGNNVASLTRSGIGYSVGDRRSYDAWGQVRAQQSGGDPKLRYCASLGHKVDDESGLVYMRARYYEPGRGRFVIKDPDLDGGNAFIYCANDPVNKVDATGKVALIAIGALIGGIIALIQTTIVEIGSTDPPSIRIVKIIAATAIGAVGGGMATLGLGASVASGVLGNFLNSVVLNLANGNGWSGVNWKKAAVAAGIGGTFGLAFGAIGASYGRSLAVSDELSEIFGNAGGALGDFTGAAVGNAAGGAYYP